MAEKPSKDVDKAILALSLQNIENLSIISGPITAAATRTRSHLLITIFWPSFANASGTGSWHAVHKLLTHAYVQATRVSQKHNRILMMVDVVLRGVHDPMEGVPIDDWDVIFYSGNTERPSFPATSLPVLHLPADLGSSTIQAASFDAINQSSSYSVVALGGTFDHLHAGHKILLSMAAWITEDKIIVGVTDDALLTKKAHKDLLEPISIRRDAVRDFLRLFKPGLIYDVVPINDVYGPTAWDPNVQALVVSKETLPGAASIASLRAEKSFPPLATFVIDVISAVSADLGTDDPETLKNAKMSSTYIRQWIYEQNSKPTATDVPNIDISGEK
ncbi:Nucleotidylyl transferase [Ramaria rubella]|nr:Nucleotidylyl transferase [Ramaria rubella]